MRSALSVPQIIEFKNSKTLIGKILWNDPIWKTKGLQALSCFFHNLIWPDFFHDEITLFEVLITFEVKYNRDSQPNSAAPDPLKRSKLTNTGFVCTVRIIITLHVIDIRDTVA